MKRLLFILIFLLVFVTIASAQYGWWPQQTQPIRPNNYNYQLNQLNRQMQQLNDNFRMQTEYQRSLRMRQDLNNLHNNLNNRLIQRNYNRGLGSLGNMTPNFYDW